MRGDEVVSVRGDDDDVFSHGFLCPKSQGLKQLHDDPDRLAVRSSAAMASWSRRAGGGVRGGRPRPLAGARRGRPRRGRRLPRQSLRAQPRADDLRPGAAEGARVANIYSASTVDQMPKQVSAGLMFGGALSVPVPDLDRTDHLLILGANPLVSNGSLLTAPDARGRIRGIRERGGKVVVVDPRVSRTAKEAAEHHFIRPGTDALLLFAIASVICTEGLADPGSLAEHANDADRIAGLAEPFTPDEVAAACGISADEIRRIARELAGAESAAVYGRIGTTTQALRHARELARRRPQLPHRQSRPRGRSDVRARRRRPAQLDRRGADRKGRAHRPLGEPGQRARRGVRRASGGRPRRGDHDAGRGPGARPGDDRRQSVCLDTRRGRARAGRRRGSTSWSASTSTSTKPRATQM